jgi:P27 family predicted phage terminase small subunit
MRGRKPSAASLRVIQGGATTPKTAPKAEPKAPDAPNFVKLLGKTEQARTARAEWKRVVPQLDALGIIALLDARLLTDYCIACAQLDAANFAVAADGFGAESKNPAVTAANQIRGQLKFYISELGLSPTSRMRMAFPDDEDLDDLGLD